MRLRIRWPWRKRAPLRKPGGLWPGVRETYAGPAPTIPLAPPASDQVIIPAQGFGLAPVAVLETPEE